MSNAAPKDFRESASLARRHAKRLVLFARSKGHKLDLDDAYSEVSLIWVKCKANFDPAMNVAFNTYWHRAIDYNFFRMIRVIVDPTLALAQRENCQVVDEDNEEHDAFQIADEGESPEDVAIRRIDLTRTAERAPLFSRIIKVADMNDPEMEKELRAARAQASYAKSRGVVVPAPHNKLTPDAMMWLFRMNWRGRTVLRNEIKELARHV